MLDAIQTTLLAGAQTKAFAAAQNSVKSEVAAQEEPVQTPSVKQDTYEPSKTTDTVDEEVGTTYKPNTKLIDQLKAEQNAVQTRFLTNVRDILSKQGKEIAVGEGIWKQLAAGDYEVDAETQQAAKEAISENGYWGIKQTSERIVQFAKALVGGNQSKIDLMKDAFIKGYDAATEAWGSVLPDITKGTYDAVMDLFDAWEQEGKEPQEPEEVVQQEAVKD